MIELVNVSKKFGGKTVVDGVTFTVNKGEIIGFLGPNGAGKTTTMRMITGFFPPSAGTVKVAGYDITKEPIKVKEQIGYMPENVPLYKELSVSDYLKFIADIKGVAKGDKKAAIERVMEETGLTGVKNSIIGKLSKGYKQRVGLAQAILNDPKVLILDEPTSGLDPKQIKEIRTLIKKMSGDRTIILSTHILPEVSVTCDKVIVINEGRIIAQDNVADLEKTFNKGARIHLEVEAPKDKFIKEMLAIKGVSSAEEKNEIEPGIYTYTIDTAEGADLRREIVQSIARNKWALLELKREQLTLEDVFLKLVTREDENVQ
ncbi:MAG: ATP-binding cassette domain-containing protein [Candidatus Goldbacteria bacterium]|nr:ATP-binding cassette domain-containing protein [Candidatus Goldiibacteriota bacterium]